MSHEKNNKIYIKAHTAFMYFLKNVFWIIAFSVHFPIRSYKNL